MTAKTRLLLIHLVSHIFRPRPHPLEEECSKAMSEGKKLLTDILTVLESYRADHERCAAHVESLCNLMTKLSYYKPDSSEVAIDLRLQQEIEDEYFEKRERLAKVCSQTEVGLRKLLGYLTTVRSEADPAIPISLETLEQMYASMVQQKMVEDQTIRALDMMMDTREINTDAFVTSVAIFKYSPYFNQGSLSTLIDSFK